MADTRNLVLKRAQRMIERDAARDKLFDELWAMYHLDWGPPEELRKLEWFRKAPSTLPRDAINTGAAILASSDPKITLMPLSDSPADATVANDRERNLLWQLKSANRRRPSTVQHDLAKSALVCAGTAALVIDLDWQIKQLEAKKQDTRRLQAMRRTSRFMVNTYNARDVHVDRNNQMVERVVLRQIRSAQEIMDEFGAKGLEKLAEEGQSVTYWDYWDLDIRAVWCEPHAGDTPAGADADGNVIWVIKPKAHKLNFLPWAALMGGSTLEDKEENKYGAILYAEAVTGRWRTQNIVKSLYVSEVIAHASAPRGVSKTADPNNPPTVDYGDPSRILNLRQGEEYDQLAPPPIDRALAEVDDRMKTDAERSTVNEIMQGGQMPTGTAFATANLLVLMGMGPLKPAKRLTEQTLAEVFTLMLLWASVTGEPLIAYGAEKNNKGIEYTIDPEEIEPDAIYIDVELTPEDPSDRQQKANTAMMLVQAGLSDREGAMESLGDPDPQRTMEKIYFERLMDNLVNMIIQKQQLQQQMEFEQARAQQAQALQAAQAAAEAERNALTGGGGGIPGGDAFNPAAGGQSPSMANPGITREMMTGQAMGGAPIAEGM